MQRRTPMAMAETASIFCETIMVAAGLAVAAGDAERLSLLNVDLQGAMPGRGRHPQPVSVRAGGVDQAAEKGTLPSAELCELMPAAQLDTYGDGLRPLHLHPYMWAVKPHYYSAAFYNWPYCFGLLFGTGLYAHYRRDPDRFRAGYDDLLSSTGLASAAGLAARFDIDLVVARTSGRPASTVIRRPDRRLRGARRAVGARGGCGHRRPGVSPVRPGWPESRPAVAQRAFR